MVLHGLTWSYNYFTLGVDIAAKGLHVADEAAKGLSRREHQQSLHCLEHPLPSPREEQRQGHLKADYFAD